MRWLVVLAVLLGCAGRARSPESPAAAANRFERVHRLIDLYDTARFAKSAEARAALGRELGIQVGTGPAATDRVIAALEVEVDKVLAADRLHAGAQAARTLLEWDGKPPAARAEVLQRMREVKAIARGKGPMAPNARLRLAGYCWRALDDATRAPWRQRPFAICHCLYALYDSDPDPYFDRDPDRRPPLPAWRDLVASTRALLSTAPAQASGALADALGAVEKHSGEMPVEPVSEVMVAADAPLYDWSPVADATTSIDVLRERIQGDGRGQVALRLDPAGKDIAALAEAARKAGAREIQLLVAHRQRIDAPSGDYWYGKSDQVTRAAVVPVSLEPLGETTATGPSSRYAVDFSGGIGLTLVIGATSWRLVGNGGEVVSIGISSAGDPRGQLDAALRRVRSAFPDHQTLALNVQPGTANSQVIAAASAAAWRNGAPFFHLGLTNKMPASAGHRLAERVKVRARAWVTVVPETLEARRPALRACYQDALDKAPRLEGKVRLEPKSGAAAVVGTADKKLAACAIAALGKAVIASGAASADVTFTAPIELH